MTTEGHPSQRKAPGSPGETVVGDGLELGVAGLEEGRLTPHGPRSQEASQGNRQGTYPQNDIAVLEARHPIF